MGQVSLRKIEYHGWPNCIEISNGTVDLVVTTDVGPRIIRFGYTGDRNEFCEWLEQSGKTGGEEWRCYGGSRLWHGPEIGKRCYEPDNIPVEWEEIENGVILKQQIEPWTKIRKEMRITLDPNSTNVHFNHKIINESPWEAKLCIWVLTLMEANGICIMPAPKQVKGMAPNGILPVGAIAFWPYTSLTDKRFTTGEKYYMLKHDPNVTQNFKIGMPIFDGWAAYLNQDHMFVKYYEHKTGDEYPDYSSSFELYCCSRFCEVETLSPMRMLKNGESIEHWEKWELHKDIKAIENEDDIDGIILPLIKK